MTASNRHRGKRSPQASADLPAGLAGARALGTAAAGAVSDTEVRLARGPVRQLDGDRRVVGARSNLLHDPAHPDRRLLIHDSEVPREGAVVQRAHQAARWYDGRLCVWIGHRKSVGRGEGSSGLRFDRLDD